MSNEAQESNYLIKNWPMLAMVFCGIVLVGVAAWVAEEHDVIHRMSLEARGTRGMATAEPVAGDEYRLRLALESAIYSRGYTGKLNAPDPESNAEFSIPVVFDPTDPARFLPAGQSFVPAIISGLLLLLGLTSALLARRGAAALARAQRLSHLKAEDERKRKKHRHKHRHHDREHHRGTSDRPV